MTPCEVHVFDPTLSLGTQQQLRLVKEFEFHDTGLIAEGVKVSVAAPSVIDTAAPLALSPAHSSQQLFPLSLCRGRGSQDTLWSASHCWTDTCL